MKLQYSIVIQWSDEDSAYLVILPEFRPQPRTHGDTYEDALKNAQEVLELLIECHQAEGWALPQTTRYQTTVPA